MTGRRSHGRLSALNGVVHQGITVASISRMIHLLADSREDPVPEENADLASQTEPSAKREARAKLESRS